MENKIESLGEFRMRTSFNPSKQDFVSDIKTKAAELIDLINGAANKPEWDGRTFGEWKRLQASALTSIEQGAMWAVKAATI